MKSLMIFAGGLLGLVCSVFAGVDPPGPTFWANASTTASIITASISLTGPNSWVNITSTPTTTTAAAATATSIPVPLSRANTTTAAFPASTGCRHGGSSATLSTTTFAVASAQQSIYTSIPSNNTNPANATVQPISWRLYEIRASVNNKAEAAHYTFKAIIEPPCSNYSVVCQETVHTDEDQLAGVDNARCKDPTGMPYTNASIPVTFHFAWRPDVNNNLGEKGNLLVVKSNLPGSARACPSFPYDACWAQGIYWVPDNYIESTFIGDKYVGPDSVQLNGTYCKAAMPECVWSEYLY